MTEFERFVEEMKRVRREQRDEELRRRVLARAEREKSEKTSEASTPCGRTLAAI